jgi:site-specific DNA recombinase
MVRDGRARAAIYCRVSTQRQADEGHSLAEQERACGDAASALGCVITDVYRDVMSGARNDRPEYQRMMDDAASAAFDVLYVWRLDRLGRDTVERLTAEAMLHNAGVELRSLTDTAYDPNDPNSIILRAVVAATAEAERGQISRRVRMAREVAAREGRIPKTRFNPYGTVIDYPTNTVSPDPVEYAHLLRLFELVGTGLSYTEVARTLDREGVPTKTRRARWTANTVRDIATNQFYIGRIKRLGEFVDGTHGDVIPRELWDSAQAHVAAIAALPGKGRGTRKTRSSGHLFPGGFLSCGVCGESIRYRPTGRGRNRYVCAPNAAHGMGTCSAPSYPQDDVDALAMEELARRHIDLNASTARWTERLDGQVASLRASADTARQDASRATGAIQRARADFIRGGDDAPSAGFLERLEAAHTAERERSLREAELLETQADEIAAMHDMCMSVAQRVTHDQLVAMVDALGAPEPDIPAVRAALARVYAGGTLYPAANGAKLVLHPHARESETMIDEAELPPTPDDQVELVAARPDVLAEDPPAAQSVPPRGTTLGVIAGASSRHRLGAAAAEPPTPGQMIPGRLRRPEAPPRRSRNRAPGS